MTRQAQNFVTILTKIHPKATSCLQRIEDEIKKQLGNYPKKKSKTDSDRNLIEIKLDAIELIHFASMHVVRGQGSKEPHYLFLELTVDGDPEAAIDSFAIALGYQLTKIYSIIDDGLKCVRRLQDRLKEDQFEIKRTPWPTLFRANSVNGLPFSGTAGLDLKDMSDDAIISEFAQDILQDININSGPEKITSNNTPGEILGYVKKEIVENNSNSVLNRAWMRANSRKMTPNFAEKMDSNWRADWNQFKLFTSIIPNWLKGFSLFVYLAIFFVMAYFFSLANSNSLSYDSVNVLANVTTSEAISDRCSIYKSSKGLDGCLKDNSDKEAILDWDTIRYTGSPLCKREIDGKIQDCVKKGDVISLYPWFLIHGILWAFLLFFALRIAPPLVRRSSGLLTLLLGFNLYLWFPHILNFNQLNRVSIGPVESHGLTGFVKLIACLFCIYLIILGVRKVLNLQLPIPLINFFNGLLKQVHFVIAFALLLGYIYLGFKFFAGYDFFDPHFNKAYKFDYKYEYKEPSRIEQYILVPALLSIILCLNVYAVWIHQPKFLKLMRLKAGRFKSWLGKYNAKFKNWNAAKFFRRCSLITIYAISHYSIYILAFSPNSDKMDLTLLFSNDLRQFLNGVVLAFILAVFTSFLLSTLTTRKFSRKPVIVLAAGFWFFVLNNLAGDHSIYLYGSLLLAIPVTLIIGLIFVAVALILYYASEHRNKQNYDNPYTNVTETLFDNENRVIQNHMISVQRLIPENFRRYIALPLMLQAIGGILGKQRFRPGFLANVGTVHSARWLHLPNTDNYIFVSNYDGSFESYLEDFAKSAVEGTNLAWNNCVGFPKVKGLFKGGVQDSDRFKRYARRSMQPTRFWYSAVSDKSAEQLRRNALIRDGLTQDTLSSSQAQAWLDLFASIPRPEWVIEKDKVQNIAFGANGYLPEGGMFTVKLSPNCNKLNQIQEFSKWVNDIKEYVTYDGERPKGKATYIAFTAFGLRVLGLSDVLDDMKSTGKTDGRKKGRTFSQPFVSGMSHESRRHILGDIGDHSPSKWTWSDKDVLAVVLAYDHEKIVDDENKPSKNFNFLTPPSARFLEIKCEQQFNTYKNLKTAQSLMSKKKKFPREPFGFADGISQPILKGTKASLRNPNSIHLVEPGEFILGYRDNSGYFPPSPVIDADKDIKNLLPNPTEEIVQRYPDFRASAETRDLGRNGSYLVIRKLEQDVEGFRRAAQTGAALLLLTGEKNLSAAVQAELSKKVDLDKYAPKNREFDIVNYLKNVDLPKGSQLVDQIFSIIETLQNGKYRTQFINTSKAIESLFMGRHKNGTSLVDSPIKILEELKNSLKAKGNSANSDIASQDDRDVDELQKENEFLFKERDPQGYKCPFGSHARRANPRDGLDPESKDSLAVTQRHRILRRGRSYTEKDKKVGTFFMCLNADIDRQFELLQQTWLMSSKFHGLREEIDPIAGQGQSNTTAKFTIQHAEGDIQIPCMSNFVKVKAGGYFFLPGKETLNFLATLHENQH